ncbi:MAG: Acetoin:2,6-dichlorophenolindophenol oxidoreductase subunit beta [Pelotomaculum sp. PtaU1.Bin065]|nr:MAG: Acetoin:2,6-dichlorophenolindophenol oxidoreductase subunit beta [Pelotomaculum sp. PtaU1.Bin065]
MAVKSYAQAINEAHEQLLSSDQNVFVIGQGVESPWCVGTTTLGLVDKFGPGRVIDTPVSEAAVTGAAIGAAMAGMRPIVFHPRMDFMYLAMDQIINHCAHWFYMFGGKVNVPVTIRGIINRGNEQAAQHSQSPFAMYLHVPGLKVVCPATPYDAKGLLVAAVRDDNPVLYIDDRWLYNLAEEVPDQLYQVAIGKGSVLREGSAVTVVAVSYLAGEALKAAALLEYEGIDVEVIDPRTMKPLDSNLILNSVRKTGRLVVAVPEWPVCGFAEHVVAVVTAERFGRLKGPVQLVTLPDTPAPASTPLERAYFPGCREIVRAVKKACGKGKKQRYAVTYIHTVVD